jgi:hypothetical protein
MTIWGDKKITEKRLRECVQYFSRHTKGERLAFWITPDFWAIGGPKKGIKIYNGLRSYIHKSQLMAQVCPEIPSAEKYAELAHQLDNYME